MTPHRPPATAVVVTTIFPPDFLSGFLQQMERRNDSTSLYIIVDRKTPPSVMQAAERARREGFDVRCPTLAEQDSFLNSLAAGEDFIPWNSDNRRNVGFLMALADGAEVLVSIDDDNFCLPDEDFFGAHQIVGRPCGDPVIQSTDGWFNICDLLDGWPANEVFPRGFPYFAQRAPRTVALGQPDRELPIGMNAGLWLSDPDVDAVYRLARRPNGTSFRGQSVVLGPHTWSPINTQNTALTRELATCYYYVRMGFPLQGLAIDRFGDILSGYLTQKVAKHLGWGIRIGTPIVDHRRTQHNLFKDLYHELAGIVLVEELLPWLMELRLTGETSLEAYRSLAEALNHGADRFRGFVWDDGGREFLRATAAYMNRWADCVRRCS